MRELSEEEARCSRAITVMLSELPPFLSDYVSWLEHCGVSLRVQYTYLSNLKLLLSCLDSEVAVDVGLSSDAEGIYYCSRFPSLIKCYVDSPVRKSVKNRRGIPSASVKLQRWKAVESFQEFYEIEKGWKSE